MTPDAQIEAAYGQFLGLNAALFAAGHYEGAYHALMGAMHVAEDAERTDRLTEVAGLARLQRAAIDALTPPHRLSTQLTRAGRSIYEMGAAMAEAVVQRLESKHRFDERHRAPS